MKRISLLVMGKIILVSKLFIFFFITLSCDKKEISPDVYFPVGRISVLNDDITVQKNSQDVIYELVRDKCGGYLLKFDASQYDKDDELLVTFTRTDEHAKDFRDRSNQENWLKASYHNDCDNDTVIRKAQEITSGLTTNTEKATAIHSFILDNLEFDTHYYDSAAVIVTSQFLEDGMTGVCINFSRLYVSLCRAAGVPARSVWGVVYGSDDDGVYNYHHQWAEFCDDHGFWHACDFTYRTDYFNNDMRYIDLIYGAEEYSSMNGSIKWMLQFENIGFTLGGYPVVTGDFGFDLVEDNRPENMIVQYTIQF